MRPRRLLGHATIWSTVSQVALGMVAAAGLSACVFADPDGSAIDVRNDTDQRLWLDDDPANGQSRRVRVEPHDYRKVYLGECTTGRLEAQTRSGRVAATLSSAWCPGQDWVITAEGEFVLDRTP